MAGQMQLLSQLHRVRVENIGLNHRSVIETNRHASQIADFANINGTVTILFLPMRENISIANICRLSGEQGYIKNDCLHITHEIEANGNTAFNFKRIFLSWGGPMVERKNRRQTSKQADRRRELSVCWALNVSIIINHVVSYF